MCPRQTVTTSERLTNAFVDFPRAVEELQAFALIVALQLDTLGKDRITVIVFGAPESSNAIIIFALLKAFVAVALVRPRCINTCRVCRADISSAFIDICTGKKQRQTPRTYEEEERNVSHVS